jgi:hypothetical protein
LVNSKNCMYIARHEEAIISTILTAIYDLIFWFQKLEFFNCTYH